MTNKGIRKKINKLYRNDLRLAEGNADEQQCCESMKKFRELYRKYKPPKEPYYSILRDWHYGYFYWLIPLWRAFEKGDFKLALHELISLINYVDIYQPRVKTSVMDLLDKYI